MDDFAEIQALRQELEQAGYAYYVLDNPTMSDYDYDHKLRRLEELEAGPSGDGDARFPHPAGRGKPLESFAQVAHRVPLESLQDVFDFDELRAFDQRVKGVTPDADYVVEPKVDGLSVALEYEDGLLSGGPSRGRRPGGGGCDGKSPDDPVHPAAHPRRPGQPDCAGGGLYAQACVPRAERGA